MRALTGSVCVAVAITALVVPAAAPAAAPSAGTGGAKSVTASSAVLTGTVNPNNEATTYYFEYGATKTYGTQTPVQGPTGAVKANTAVSATIGGLTAGGTYHYRLVATNASGTKLGRDKSFKTPAGITFAGSPRTLVFGKAVVLSGQLTAGSPGGVKITLEQDPAPFNVSDFKSVATTTADASGRFSFTQAPAANTAYRVSSATNPKATSATVNVGVRTRVTLALSTSHPKRGALVVFRGAASPAHNGQLVRIQKRVGTGWRTVARTLLSATTDPAVSAFKTRVRVRRNGVYRAYVSGDASNLAGWSGRRTIRVR
jgi:hypothetical protein